MLDNGHLDHTPDGIMSMFLPSLQPVRQQLSRVVKACYPRPEDKQVRVKIEQHPMGSTVLVLLELQRR